jgi:Holliday junction resolvase
MTIGSFKKENNIFLFSDQNGKRLFKEILKTFGINFFWSSGRQNKMPDVVFKSNKDIYIVEHKHMKEGGGGQDKQVSEVVDFINYSEAHASVPVHYITFVDGLYFNLFARSTNKNGKLAIQIANIRKNLSKNQTNYFVNTAGFRKLLKHIRK